MYGIFIFIFNTFFEKVLIMFIPALLLVMFFLFFPSFLIKMFGENKHMLRCFYHLLCTTATNIAFYSYE